MFSCFTHCPTKSEKLQKELILGIDNNDADKVRSALARGAAVDFDVTPKQRKSDLLYSWGNIPLVHFAAMLAHASTEILQQIVQAGAPLEQAYEDPQYPNSGSILHNALHIHNHAPTFEFLIANGADVNATNSKGISVVNALLIITPPNHRYYTDSDLDNINKLSVLKVFIENNANLNESDIKMLLELVRYNGKITRTALDVLSLCIDRQINVAPDASSTILHFIADQEITINDDTRDAINNLLNKAIEAGIFINKQDENGRTPLHIALGKKSQFFESLMSFVEDTDINIADSYGVTPLHLAASNGADDTKLLLDRNADVNLVDKLGRTVMHYAKDQFVFDLLVAKNAPIDKADKYGVTPLMKATEAGKLKLISKLLAKGADITATDHNGQNIIMYAQNNKYTLTAINAHITLAHMKQSKNSNQLTMS